MSTDRALGNIDEGDRGLPELSKDEMKVKREHLHLTFKYKMVEGLMPETSTETFLTPQKQGRQI